MLKNAKQFILAGNAYFTIDNGKGEHFTYRVNAYEGKSQSMIDKFFVSLLTGPDNTRNYTYMGILDGSHQTWRKGETFKPTAKSKVQADALSWRVFEWFVSRAFSNIPLPEGYDIKHSGRCGRCGRMLTVPESIDSGIGPECAKIMGINLEGAE